MKYRIVKRGTDLNHGYYIDEKIFFVWDWQHRLSTLKEAQDKLKDILSYKEQIISD